MNINHGMWSSLIGKEPKDLYDPDHNIEAGVVLLKRITERSVDKRPGKIGSLWKGLGLDETEGHGEYIENLYREKPWLK